MNAEFYENLSRQFETLPDRLGGHIVLSLAALAIGVLISIPLGIYASRHKKLESVALLVTSVIQTIPSLALLALMVFLWGTIGWGPALIALVLYSLLPILRNTIIGIKNVDPAAIEAAKGVGMTEFQMLWIVQLPLASSTILAGIRTATVWIVGTATIADLVGATSLGNYIFVGLQTSNSVALVFGCIFSALLALILDGILRRMEQAVKERNRSRIYVLLGMLLLVILSPSFLTLIQSGPKAMVDRLSSKIEKINKNSSVIVGGKAFTEQYILTSMIQSQLESAGMETEVKGGMGSTILFESLQRGDIDVYVEYSGTVWATILKRKDIASGPPMLIDVAAALKEQYGIIMLGSLGFQNNYAISMRRDHAEKLGIKTMVDLAKHARQFKAGAEFEFFARAEWQRMRELYGIEFSKEISIDATLMYPAIKSGQLDVIMAFSTDGRIDAFDLKVIEDTRHAFPPYDAIILLSPQAAQDDRIVKALMPLVNHISTTTMRDANKRVDLDDEIPSQVAQELLKPINAP